MWKMGKPSKSGWYLTKLKTPHGVQDGFDYNVYFFSIRTGHWHYMTVIFGDEPSVDNLVDFWDVLERGDSNE